MSDALKICSINPKSNHRYLITQFSVISSLCFRFRAQRSDASDGLIEEMLYFVRLFNPSPRRADGVTGSTQAKKIQEKRRGFREQRNLHWTFQWMMFVTLWPTDPLINTEPACLQQGGQRFGTSQEILDIEIAGCHLTATWHNLIPVACSLYPDTAVTSQAEHSCSRGSSAAPRQQFLRRKKTFRILVN